MRICRFFNAMKSLLRSGSGLRLLLGHQRTVPERTEKFWHLQMRLWFIATSSPTSPKGVRVAGIWTPSILLKRQIRTTYAYMLLALPRNKTDRMSNIGYTHIYQYQGTFKLHICKSHIWINLAYSFLLNFIQKRRSKKKFIWLTCTSTT